MSDASRPSPPRFVVADYDPERDDLECQALERRATQGHWLVECFVKIAFIQNQAFHTKAHLYSDHIILVARTPTRDDADLANSANSVVCGVICVGIKEVTLRRRTCKVGYVFDLRVAPEVQRCGLGKLLSTEAEALAVARGVEALYLSVNGNNAKAVGLYGRLGFRPASVRAPSLSVLLTGEHRATQGVARVPVEDVPSLLYVGFDGEDLALKDVTSVLASRCYLGTFVAREPAVRGARGEVLREASSASLSLWNGSAVCEVVVDRIFNLPLGAFCTTPFQCLYLVATCVLLWHAGVRGSQVRGHVGASVFAGGVVCLAATALSLWVLCLRALATFFRDRTRTQNIRARLFAPTASGPRGGALLARVGRHMHNVARREGFLVMICNMDERNPLRAFMPTAKFRTRFLHKDIGGGALMAAAEITNTHPESSLPYTPGNFFDPRDI